jgi:hypothetical protein
MIRENAGTPADGGAHVEVPFDRDAMVGLMRRYRRARQEREEAEANGAAYVAQVREEVKQDLAPVKEHEERLRDAMLVFVREHNGGASFRVPGLGTAHTQSRCTTEILDRGELVRHLEAYDPDALAAIYDAKLNDSRAKKLALARATEDGEVLPGTDTQKRETLVVKLA